MGGHAADRIWINGRRRGIAGKDTTAQARLVSTNCWPAELVQVSWFIDTIMQLKLIGV
jgi:hypothetical protein